MIARAVGGRVALPLTLAVGAILACDATSLVADPDDGIALENENEIPLSPDPDEAESFSDTIATSGGVLSQVVPPSRVVLVTVDGVRWEDVFGSDHALSSATVPNLARLVDEGGVAFGGPGCAHDVRASGPNYVSLPGYLEIFRGKATRCTHNGCPPTEDRTIIDDAQAAAHRTGEVAVFASWNRYANAVSREPSSIVLSAGARTTSLRAAKDDDKLRAYLDAGAAHSGYPGWGDYRPDVHTSRIALRYLETVGPRLLVVGLGDADEQAHRGDVPGYRRAIRRADDFLGDLERTLARMGDEGRRTAVVVTTDHGRAESLRHHGARFPESQRVWVAAFGSGIAHRGVACAAAPLHLADVAGTVRGLLALDPVDAIDGARSETGPLAAELLDGSRSAM